ncbi:LysR family transcriptional regulator [Humibacter sp. BT305]|nr:LysR family transcriptional regulator [Humibacter sp. BT305]
MVTIAICDDRVMEIRQVETFLAVARELNFTRAAETLHTAQSAVSATVRGLERELGLELFDRSTRRIVLTPAGEALVPRAIDLLDAAQAAKDAVADAAGRVTGSLRIGFMASVTLYDIPRLLGRFGRMHGDVAISLLTSPQGTSGLAEMLRSGEIDVAFLAAGTGLDASIRSKTLASSPLVLALPEGHPFLGRSRVSLAEAVGEALIDFPSGFGNRTIVDRRIAQAGLARTVRFETNDIADAAELVRNGLAAAFLPRFVVDRREPLPWVEVTGLDAELAVAIAVSSERRLPEAARRLWGLALAD